MYRLFIEDDDGTRSAIGVDLGAVTIGRDAANAVRLNERNVSRRHVSLRSEGGRVYALDLDSFNGVYLNDRRIEGTTEIYAGDLLRVGDFTLELAGEALKSRDDETTEPDIFRPEADPRDEPTEVIGPAPEPTAIIHVDHLADLEGRRTTAESLDTAPQLLCVSTPLAGEVWSLDEPEMRLGRGVECDVRIDHRSVSNQHAKIVATESDRHIVDLDSSNGTLVNGEKYGRVALRGGDVIELGHVKLRYLPHGHAYTPDPTERAAIAAASEARGHLMRRSRSVWIFGVAATALVITVGAGAFLLGQETVDSPPPPLSSAAIIAQAQDHLEARDWSAAITLLESVVAREPGRRDAVRLLAHARRELSAAHAFERLRAASARHQWSEVLEHAAGIPPLSVYAPEAEPYVQHAIGALRAIDVAPPAAAPEAAPEPEPAPPDKKKKKKRQGHREAAAPRARGSQPTEPAAVVEPAVPPPTPDAMRPKATAAIKAGRVNEGIELLNQCLQVARKHCGCHRDLGIAYGKLKKYERTARHYRLYLRYCPDTTERAAIEQWLAAYGRTQRAR